MNFNPISRGAPAIAAAVALLTFAIRHTAGAQGASYDVSGISAWSTAKTYGFAFNPEANSGESVSRPLDGMNTRLTRTEKVVLLTVTKTVAQVVGGQPSVNAGERNTTFTLFGGRTLQPGWTVKAVDVTGNFTYVQQPRLGTTDLSFRVRLSPGGGATLRKLVLNGPSGADWHDAFSAPLRKDYVINGTVAWNAARKYGFTFKPLQTGSSYGDHTLVDGSPDGSLIGLTISGIGISADRCTPWTGGEPKCVVGQIAGGNMSVTKPIATRSIDQKVVFEMFGNKRLSSGWMVKSVSTSAGVFQRQATVGSNDLSFVLSLSSFGDQSATAIVKSITLEGPSNAASFEDAFRNPPQ